MDRCIANDGDTMFETGCRLRRELRKTEDIAEQKRLQTNLDAIVAKMDDIRPHCQHQNSLWDNGGYISAPKVCGDCGVWLNREGQPHGEGKNTSPPEKVSVTIPIDQGEIPAKVKEVREFLEQNKLRENSALRVLAALQRECHHPTTDSSYDGADYNVLTCTVCGTPV